MRDTLSNLSRPAKIALQIGFDAVVVVFAFAAAHVLDAGTVGDGLAQVNWVEAAIGVPLATAALYALGAYRSLIRFTSANTLAVMVLGAVLSTAALVVASFLIGSPITWVVAVTFFLLFTGVTIGSRFLLRSYFRSTISQSGKNVVIYGAKDLGRQLLTSLQQGVEYHPIAMLDDSKDLQGLTIGGVPIHSPSDLQVIASGAGVEIVFIAMSEVSRQAKNELAEILKSTPIEVMSIPSVRDIHSGRAKITDFREVRIEDLLGRTPVPANPKLLRATTQDKTVLVTGAGGSIGSEICRQLLKTAPKKLILFDHSEFALYALERELAGLSAETGAQVEIDVVLGSVCDQRLVAEAFQVRDIDTVFHAAAYKHVPMLEHNILSAIENNAFGTANVVAASVEAGVSHFTLVSTDKAVRPTNVMGATKRLAELICQAQADIQNTTKISMVRFGNVLGSSGSVIPLFKKQIAAGGPVTVTHKNITRYFMTIPEASQLVIQSSAMARGGDVFLLDMGEPIAIVDLAKSMIRLSGFEPFVSWEKGADAKPTADEIEIVFTGLRDGEKLYEELLIDADARPTEHPRIMMAQENKLEIRELEIELQTLKTCIEQRDEALALATLKKLPLEYAATEMAVA